MSCYVSILICCVLLLSGCSNQDFGRPMGSRITDIVDSGKAYRETDQEREAKRAKLLANAMQEWQNSADNVDTSYILGKGDVLEISIHDFEEPGSISKMIKTIDDRGVITLPWVGEIPASGLSVNGLEDRLRILLNEKYLKDPQLSIKIDKYQSAPVLITGAVKNPGVFYLKQNKKTILEMLVEAEGLSAEAGDELILIRGGSNQVSEVNSDIPRENENTLVIDLRKLVDDGNMSMNLFVHGNDVITVPPKVREFIYVLGYVQRPGSYEKKPNTRLNALQAVAMAGGLAPSARSQNSCLISKTDKGQKIEPVDLTKIARGVRPPLYMKSGDTLVVGSSTFARLSEFIKPSVGAGVNYAPVP